MKAKFSLMKYAKIFVGISIVTVLIGLIAFFTMGFKFGIDFTGGTIFTLSMGQTVTNDDTTAVENIAKKYFAGDVLSSTSQNNSIVLKYQDKDAADADSSANRMKMLEEIKVKYPNVTVGALERVGASAGDELRRNAVLSIAIAAALMLVYVWFRFEVVFGVAAITALFYDLAIMASFMVFTQTQVNSTFVAALLTILGYSINDTIVVFDRIRENLKKYRNFTRAEIIDLSYLETLRRTINTSLTVLFMIIVLYFLGVQSIKEFAFPILVGVVSGTYSSIFVASPLWMWIHDAVDKRNKAKKATGSGNKQGPNKSVAKKPIKAK